ncbi:MAG TPA: hypothetical protein VFS94_11550 [Gemmatimonadales bacterium]|nr:hypothetical protein [Gemmatimonadales bacterium]
MTTPPPSGPPTPEKKALLDAYEQALKSPQAPEPSPRRPRSDGGLHPLTLVAIAALIALAAWLAIARPGFVFDRGAPDEPRSVRDASLRLAMAMQYQRVLRYRDSAGGLPDRLTDVGPVVSGIRFEPIPPDQFTLVGENGDVVLTLRSTDQLRDFVGGAYQVLESRGTR